MFRYLKAAFFETLGLPALGQVPLNGVACLVAFILGFGHPAFWLLGLGLETAYLAALATSARYQRVVDARDRTLEADADATTYRAQAERLQPAEAERLRALEAKCERAVALAREQSQEQELIDGNSRALDTLGDLYLRLLLTRQLLLSPDARANEERLRRQMADLQVELAGRSLQASLRASKAATLDILQRRLQTMQRRDQSLAEIEADLARIEAQVDLAVENAGISGEPQIVSSNISLVSQWLEPGLRGWTPGTLMAGENSPTNTSDADASPRAVQKEHA